MEATMNRYLLLLLGVILIPGAVSAQVVDQFAPPRANCCGRRSRE